MAMWSNESDYDILVNRAATRTGVPMGLIKAVIAAESSFRPDAIRVEDFTGREPPSDWPEGVTRDASRGLMQVLCWRARWLGYQGDCDGLFDPATNIALGARLLAINAARLGSWPAAVSAYNGGIRPELGYGKKIDGRFRNQGYVDRVMRYWVYFDTGEMPTQAGFGTLALLAVLGVAAAGFFVGKLDVHLVMDTVIVFMAGGAWWQLRDMGKRVYRIESKIFGGGG